MSARNRHRQGMTVWMSCPICKKKWAGTPDWVKIPTFPHGKGLDEHMKTHEVEE